MDPQDQTQATQNIPSEIRDFLQNILQEANMTTLDDQTKEGMIQELFYQLDNFLTSVIVESLQPEDLDTFVKMNEEKKSKEEIEAFVKEKLPNAEDVFADAFMEFRDTYLDNIAASRDQQNSTQ